MGIRNLYYLALFKDSPEGTRIQAISLLLFLLTSGLILSLLTLLGEWMFYQFCGQKVVKKAKEMKRQICPHCDGHGSLETLSNHQEILPFEMKNGYENVNRKQKQEIFDSFFLQDSIK